MELVLIQFDRLRLEIYLWIPDNRVVYLPAVVEDVEEMVELMKGRKRLQVRNKDQLGGGGLFVDDLPPFLDEAQTIPPLARAASQASGQHSMRAKSKPVPRRLPVATPVVKQRKAGEPPSPHADMVRVPAPVRASAPHPDPAPPPASSRVASMGPPPLMSPPAPPASSQLPSPPGSASESSMPKPRSSARSLGPENPLGGEVKAIAKGKGDVAKAAARVLRKRSASKGLKMPVSAVNRRDANRTIDSLTTLGDSVDLTTPTSGDDQRPPASADVTDPVQRSASSVPPIMPFKPPASADVTDPVQPPVNSARPITPPKRPPASADVAKPVQPPWHSVRPITPPKAKPAPGPAIITPQPPVPTVKELQEEMARMAREMARTTDLVQQKERAREMYHRVQAPDGEQHALDELERREALMRDGSMDSADVLHPFLHRDDATGQHLGHLIARLSLTQLGRAFHQRHRERWTTWMNTPTYSQKAPMNWSPLMCIMESTSRPRASAEDIEILLVHIACSCTSATLRMASGGTGGTFLHMARKPERVDIVMEALARQRRDPRSLVAVLNIDGRSPYDVHWNSTEMREKMSRWGDTGVRPVPRNTGKTGKGRGKGAKDGIAPGHPWNRNTWRRTY